MRAMITIQFDDQRREEINSLIPKEQQHVRELMTKGTLEAIYISADRTVVWVILKGDSQEQIQQELSGFPLYPYMRPEITPLL